MNLLAKRLTRHTIPVLSSLFLACIISCNTATDGNPDAGTGDSLDEASMRKPENALKGLKAADGITVTVMATEPLLRNPTNIDVDDKGRIWLTEAYNYRPEINGNPVNPNGDRILILSDKDGDGLTETAKVFYQGPEINAPLGVCVLGNKVLISQSPYVWAFYDDNGDDSADRKEIIFQGIGGEQHDHGMHTFTFGPDGKLYFNFGNAGVTLKDKNGKTVRDQDGDEIGPKKYREGMVFRCNPDGSQVECLGHNFRNNYEVAVDSYGTLWQSDNDDDGNRGVRINYVMDYGNYGYRDEMTGAGWEANRTNLEDSIMFRHWHLNDPGVVPNLLQTGAGSPTGILVYEGSLLPEAFRNQVIHTDAGVNVVRAYPVNKTGAGFSASILNLLHGDNDQWFRPADVCVAPDGSLIVADWYDPGVGGHQAGDQQKGRIYRIAPADKKYIMPQINYSTAAGAVAALQNPNLSVRYHAWQALNKIGETAVPELEKLWKENKEPRMRARAFWVLAKMKGGDKYINEAVKDAVPEIRICGIRAAREAKVNIVSVVTALANDNDMHVLRECAIALRHVKDPQAAKLWALLASKYQGGDRWYLEALGIGADRQWDSFFNEYAQLVKDPLSAAGGKEIVWRARTDKAVPLLAKLAADSTAGLASRLKYFRAFDFNTGPAKSRYLLALIEKSYGKDAAFTKLLLYHLDPATVMRSVAAKNALADVLRSVENTGEFTELVKRYEYASARPQLLQMASSGTDEDLATDAAGLLLHFKGKEMIRQVLLGADTAKSFRLMTALGRTGSREAIDLLIATAMSEKTNSVTRKQAIMQAGRSMNGEDRLLVMLESRKIPEALIPSAVEGMRGAWRKMVYDKAKTYLPGYQETREGTAEPVFASLASLKSDPANGRNVFKTTCSVCHQADGMGQNFGPALSEIGSKLPKEALLEAIVHPSSGISFGYETSVVNMKDGTTYTGIVSSRTEDEVDLKMPGGTVQKLKTSAIESTSQTKESMMPALASALSQQELADLLDYLSGLKKRN